MHGFNPLGTIGIRLAAHGLVVIAFVLSPLFGASVLAGDRDEEALRTAFDQLRATIGAEAPPQLQTSFLAVTHAAEAALRAPDAQSSSGRSGQDGCAAVRILESLRFRAQLGEDRPFSSGYDFSLPISLAIDDVLRLVVSDSDDTAADPDAFDCSELVQWASSS
jgi:hypothetical protein